MKDAAYLRHQTFVEDNWTVTISLVRAVIATFLAGMKRRGCTDLVPSILRVLGRGSFQQELKATAGHSVRRATVVRLRVNARQVSDVLRSQKQRVPTLPTVTTSLVHRVTSTYRVRMVRHGLEDRVPMIKSGPSQVPRRVTAQRRVPRAMNVQ